jgi:N-acetylglutamate synthase-like GNAT family acetyltransferase
MAFTLRPATAAEDQAIRGLIRQVRINPMGLDWQRFVVAVDEQGTFIGCGQLKPHKDGSCELASIAVVPGWRGRGVARAIIERLLSGQQGDIYLTARAGLGPLYEKFGFVVLSAGKYPPYFRTISRIARLLLRLGIAPEPLLVMRREAGSG